MIKICGSLAVVLGASACGLLGQSPHTPKGLEGPVTLTVANNTNEPVCVIAMYPAGAAGQRLSASGVAAENWLGSGHNAKELEPGRTINFGVQAGTYKTVIQGCALPMYVAGTASLVLQQATYLSFGSPSGTPPSGETLASLEPQRANSLDEQQAILAPLRASGATGGGAGGDSCVADGERSAAGGGDCCSSSYHPMFLCNSNQTVDICGAKRDGEGSSLPCP